ncbi:GAF domain-containing protein [Flexithrix dorotheae]|uniref:GAF domain-containing protein n=1 Tax=Flexithrix dorotheae TaxID=70993 RepID=UPI00036E1A87|nr:GAF domain-containing protein [Flexithrix dorotheae]
MAEELLIPENTSKAETYQALIPQIKALIEAEKDLIANLANISAALKTGFNFFWVGFYILKNEQLVLGPFQGPIACTRINLNKGVCGAAFQQKKTILVPNVDEFPGHIACSSDSKSEIVVPVIKNDKVEMVLDIDSDQLNDFDETDQKSLEVLMALLSNSIE